jgi:hypothetical protein
VAACQEALDHGSWANCRGLVQVVLSMTTYGAETSFLCH